MWCTCLDTSNTVVSYVLLDRVHRFKVDEPESEESSSFALRASP